MAFDYDRMDEKTRRDLEETGYRLLSDELMALPDRKPHKQLAATGHRFPDGKPLRAHPEIHAIDCTTPSSPTLEQLAKPKRKQAGREAPRGILCYPRGRQLCCFTISGRAVPWGHGRKLHTKPKRLIEWQSRIQAEAAIVYGWNKEPYEGPVKLVIGIHMWPGGVIPDVTNCLKAIEDALQGVVYHNDRQTPAIDIQRIFDTETPQYVFIEVLAH